MAYGILFGVSPTLVADTFGVGGLSQNWGFMTLAPAFFGEAFTLIYGLTLDAHSKTDDKGHSICKDGKSCYRVAYAVTLVGSVIAMTITLWCIRHRHIKEAKLRKQEEENDDDHIE